MIQNMKTILSAVKQYVEKGLKKSIPDWNENNPDSINYIKNRPFYEKDNRTTIYLNETIIDGFSETDNLYKVWLEEYIELDDRVVLGETYTVSYDGVEYSATLQEEEGGLYFGINYYHPGYYNPDNLPFGIWLDYNWDSETDKRYATQVQCVYTDSSTSASHTITIYKGNIVIKKIDEKYLPDSITPSESEFVVVTRKADDSDSATYSSYDIYELCNEGKCVIFVDGDMTYYLTYSEIDPIVESTFVSIWGDRLYIIRVSGNGSITKENLDIGSGEGIDLKMDKTNPVGAGSFSMNRKANTTIGINSHAEGSQTTASGKYSHAEGDTTTASGESSHAEGAETKASGTYSHAEGVLATASGINSHAEGYYTKASGENSHAEGNSTKASGLDSHAEGSNTTASGASSHAEGAVTIASGIGSHAEGCNTKATTTDDAVTTTTSTSKGYYTHAEGYGSVAYGRCSHAEGHGTKASGYDSHSEGYRTTASGVSSHAEGSSTVASGSYSHAEGYGITAQRKSQHVQGEYNILDTDGSITIRGKYVHIVGNGTTTNARSNAHTLDWNGLGWFAGGLKIGGTGQDDETAKTVATLDDLAAISIEGATSWNDLKDRPFYEEGETILLPESAMTYEDNVIAGMGAFALMSDIEFNANESYIVTYNGVRYEGATTTAQLGDFQGTAFGNLAVIGGENTGEPFLMGHLPGVFILIPLDSPSTVSISIAKPPVVHKLDNKFLDLDWIPSEETVETVILDDEFNFDTTVTGANGDTRSNLTLEKLFDMKAGIIYTVVWDGVNYSLYCKETVVDDCPALYLGNAYLINETFADSNTGENICIVIISAEDMWVTRIITNDRNADKHTIKVIEPVNVYEPIPEKYLPMDKITEKVLESIPVWNGGAY